MPNYLASMTKRGFKGITSDDLNVSVSLLITITIWIKINPYHRRAFLKLSLLIVSPIFTGGRIESINGFWFAADQVLVFYLVFLNYYILAACLFIILK
jgi:hypothetical protein